MTCVRKYHKLTIAEANLHRAINLFLEGEHGYINALVLATAAEEILGKYVRKFKGVAAIDNLLEGVSKALAVNNDKELRDKMNFSKNTVKHYTEGEEELIELDWETEAMNMIIRASINWKKLKPETEHIKIFTDFIRKTRPDLFKDLESSSNQT